MEIADEEHGRKEDSRIMPIELMIEFETTTGHSIPENLKTHVQDQERRHNPRLTSVIRAMNKMLRNVAMNNIHPEDRANFHTKTTGQCNTAKYAIARKQPSVQLRRAARPRQMEQRGDTRREAGPRDRDRQLRH